jgi:hypothetical protein
LPCWTSCKAAGKVARAVTQNQEISVQQQPLGLEKIVGLGIGFGLTVAILGSVFIFVPLSQCLIDSDNDDVVLLTILYFKWAVVAFWFGCCGTCVAIVWIAEKKSTRAAIDDRRKTSTQS